MAHLLKWPTHSNMHGSLYGWMVVSYINENKGRLRETRVLLW